MTDYCSLHNHTHWSLMDSLMSPEQLLKKAKELGQSSIAITDHGCLIAGWDALKIAKEIGIKLIIGEEFYFVDDVADTEARLRHVICLAKDHQGYRNLLALSKEGYDNYQVMFKRAIPRIDWKMLEKYAEGLICTTACGGGIVSQLINTRRLDEAKATASRLKGIFGQSLALEIQPHTMRRVANLYKDYEDQKFTNHQLIKIADELDIKVIVATDAHYLEPEDHEAHDAMLAIASGQPVQSGNRLRYTNDFYVMSREEIIKRLSTVLVGANQKRAEEFCDNTLFFSAMCEEPNWINPKFSNPTGNELPDFKVVEQPDYQEFCVWSSEQDDVMRAKPHDVQYLWFWLKKVFVAKAPADQVDLYWKRILKEMEILEMKNLCSYMLIVADYVGWAKRNGIPVGAGRGCLIGDTLVHTDQGYKKLNTLKRNDLVYTHTGQKQKILDTFEYDVSKEKLIEVCTEYSFLPIVMTKDHKVYGAKAVKSERYTRYENEQFTNKIKKWNDLPNPQWIPIGELSVGDSIFATFPIRNVSSLSDTIDIGNFAENSLIYDDVIIQSIPLDNNLSIRKLSKNINVSRCALKRIKNQAPRKKTNSRTLSVEQKLSSLLLKDGLTINDWINEKNIKEKIIKRFIPINEDFLYFIGRFVGDGWIRSDKTQVGIAFNSDDTKGIHKISTYLESLGFEVSRNDSKTKKLTQLKVYGKILINLLTSLIPDYKSTSATKHLPINFRELPDNLLRSLLCGLIDSDGHVDFKENTESVDTTSLRLALELKEALFYLRIPCYLTIRKPWLHGNYLCKESFKIRFKGINLEKTTATGIRENGYYCKIKSLKEVSHDKVYDIHVENDTSYLTSNYVVHNSAAGSLVGYFLDIHEADSLKYGLLFERFYNKAKTGLSDIDVDFGQKGKPLVEQYIINKYGAEYCAQVTNYAELTPKPYAKAIARAFVYGGDRKAAVKFGNDIASIIPKELHTVATIAEYAPLFAEYAKQPKYEHLTKFAKHIGNKYINCSTHAGAMIIGKRPLHHIVPVRRSKDGNYLVEFEKERAEESGLAKMDLLGLSNLDIIEDTFDLIRQRGKTPPSSWTYDDKATYELISSGKTFGVFQFGKSAGTIDLCKKMVPENILDLAMINALTRPGFPKEVRDDFIAAKKSGQANVPLHPVLEKAFKETFGYALYDEVLMQLAVDFAGWDLNEADRLRKFVKEKGKHPEKDKKLKKDLINSAILNVGLSKETANKIWDEVISNFGAYAFNKSHAVTYSFLAYQTAYLKAHFPLEFLIANINFQSNSNALDSEDNIKIAKDELRELGVQILPPDVNLSEKNYKIIDDKTVLTGFDALKYMGQDAIPEIVAKRPFTDLEQFLTAVDGSKVKAPAIQALAASGCLEGFGMPRRQMYLYAADYKKKLQVFLKRKKKDGGFQYPWPDDKEDWTIAQKYALERYYIGEGLTGTKIQAYPGFFTTSAPRFDSFPILFPNTGEEKAEMAIPPFQAEIIDFFEFRVKKEDSKDFGKPMAKIRLEDPYGNPMTMTVFARQWADLKERVKVLTGGGCSEFVSGIAIYARGKLQWYGDVLQIVFEDLLKCAPPPPLPPDFKKAKQVSMKVSKVKEKAEEVDPVKFLEEVEDELIEEGMEDLEEDEFDFEEENPETFSF